MFRHLKSPWNASTREQQQQQQHQQQHLLFHRHTVFLPANVTLHRFAGPVLARHYTTSSHQRNKYIHNNLPADLPNYYFILDVTEEASAEDIKTSYLRLAKKYHPDINKHDNAEALFKSLQEAYSVLKEPNDRAFYDQMRGTGTTDSYGNREGMDVTTPPGYHMHPAYAHRATYDKASRKGLYGAMDLIFSRKGMYLLLAAPVLAMFYLGGSSLGPTKSEQYEASLRAGLLDDSHVEYSDLDRQGAEMVPAFWHARQQRWLRPETWSNIQTIGAGRQLTLVREYKTRADWKVPEGYQGEKTERERREAEAKRLDALGIPRKLTDSEKEEIVLKRLAKRNTLRKEKIEQRLKKEKRIRRRKRKEEKKKNKRRPIKVFGLPPPSS